jgi:uncharacterized protein YbjT (DUF2867 family)
VARCLIIACGCRGATLARGLIERGHAVRATTRAPERLADLEAAGAEPVIADPGRVGTLVSAFEHVSVSYVLLGSATGTPAELEALHSTRLDMLLTKMLDSTVRAIVYEAAGTVAPGVLADGAARVSNFCQDSRIPYALLRTPGDEPDRWLEEALSASERMLAPR